MATRLFAAYRRGMPEKPRILLENVFVHVNTHATGRECLFVDAYDRLSFLAYLAVVCSRRGLRLLAYCLMTNHYHLLFETMRPEYDAAMRDLNSRHCRRFNERHSRRGTLVQRRYHSTLIEDDAHLLQALRYIVLNPVSAGICAVPEAWPWSSARAMLGGRAPGGVPVAVDRVLACFGDDQARARARYAEFVADGVALAREARAA
jgi:REP element-mobilizing transposase RayT